MRGNEFLDKMSLIDPAYIEEAEVSPKRKRLAPLKKILIAAACLVIVLSVGFGGYTYAAEAIEYNNAIRFFDEYELSTEGLSRAEIKYVYRDIENKSFSYSETVYVITRNISPELLEGCVIPTENSTPKEIEAFWNYRNDVAFDTPEETDAPHPPSRGCVGPHKYEYRVITEGSCTEEGTAGNVCVNCGYLTVMATTGKVHFFGEYTVTVEATCESSGREVAECTLCGAKDEKYIPAGHVINEKNSRIVEESTCMKKGTVKYECAVCGETITERLPLIAHDWYITVQEATCTKNGFKTGVCQGCGTERRFEEYFRLGHDYKLQGNGDFQCTRCDYCHSKMFWHEVQKTVQKRATCTKEGLIYARCITCGISGEASMPKAFHDYDYEDTVIVYPTCLNEGFRKEICMHCRYENVTEYPKANHSFKKLDDSDDKYKCAVCDLEIDGPAIDEILVDGEKDETYCYYAFKRKSHNDVYLVDESISVDGANGDFEAYIALGEKGMYIYVEVIDTTPTDIFSIGCGDYVKLYLDWCTYDIIHPDVSKKKKMESLGQPWDPIKDYRDKYGVSGLQYIGWLQGYSNGKFDGGMGFAPVDSLGPNASDAVIYKSKATDDGWACEWFIPWRDDEQKQMIKDKEQFHMGLGIEVGDDTTVIDEKANATVKRFDQNKDYGIRYSEDYSLLRDIYLIDLWIYLPRT